MITAILLAALGSSGVTYYLKIEGVQGNRTDSLARERAVQGVAGNRRNDLHKETKERQKEIEQLQKQLDEAADRSAFTEFVGSLFGSDGGVGDVRKTTLTATAAFGRSVSLRLSAGAVLSRLQRAAASGEHLPEAIVDACPTAGGTCQRYVLRNVTVERTSSGGGQPVTLRCGRINGPTPLVPPILAPVLQTAPRSMTTGTTTIVATPRAR